MLKKRVWYFIALLSISLLFPYRGAEADTSVAPDFELQNLEGKRITLKSLLGKGPIILDFWATWCKPCIEEMKHLQTIYDEYRERGLHVVAISQDSPRSVSKVKSFVRGRRFTFTVLLDTNKDVYRRFHLYGLPHTFVLNSDGEIVFRRFGYRPGDETELKIRIEELMNEEATARSDSTQTDTPRAEE